MSLIEQIRKDKLQARKDGDDALKTLLAVVQGDSEKIGKDDGNREPTDQEVMRIIKKMIQSNKDVIGGLIARGNGAVKGKDAETEKAARAGNEFLKSYLPSQLSEDELAKIITEFVAAEPDANIGSVMKYLGSNYNGQYDGKMASSLVRELL